MKTLTQTYTIKVSPSKVWDALINAETINAWGGGPAIMDDKDGTHFTLWGGEIWGINKKVKAEQELQQDWYGGKWAEPSLVTFTLSPTSNGTTLVLDQKNIPDADLADIDDGWQTYYLGPMKEFLER